VAVYLVRHAHAGSRSAWKGDDERRPLSPKGRGQAEGLAARLKGEPIARVLSSPSRRCVETAEPLARAVGVEIEQRDDLHEGGDPDQVIALVSELAGQDAVIVSHGDVIPKVIRRLAADGMRTKDANLSQKGSWWTLEVNGGRVVRGRYHPPV
jgi:8-oxo-dGTP diphosphatase